jgi:ubiquinone/menaquinone biosynthesis C-methylase UbiE
MMALFVLQCLLIYVVFSWFYWQGKDGDLELFDASGMETGPWHNDIDLNALMKGSDKTLGKHSYTSTYKMLFGSQRNKVEKIIEIGIGQSDARRGYVSGASLVGWRTFFPRAEILGLDLDPASMIKGGNRHIKTAVCDQTSSDAVAALHLGEGTFDIIIDDGLHWIDANMRTLELFFPYLKEGGIYVIEDILVSKDQDYIGVFEGLLERISHEARDIVLGSDIVFVVSTVGNPTLSNWHQHFLQEPNVATWPIWEHGNRGDSNLLVLLKGHTTKANKALGPWHSNNDLGKLMYSRQGCPHNVEPTALYRMLFNPMHDIIHHVLVVGGEREICDPSLALVAWHTRFPRAHITALHSFNVSMSNHDSPRLTTLIADATSSESLAALNIGTESFDLIINDASLPGFIEQQKSMRNLFRFLKPGGVYVIEHIPQARKGHPFVDRPNELHPQARDIILKNDVVFSLQKSLLWTTKVSHKHSDNGQLAIRKRASNAPRPLRHAEGV